MIQQWQLWAVGIALGVAFIGAVIFKIFAAGKSAAVADAALTGLNRAIVANQAKQEALRNPKPDRANDPNNRDNRR